MFTSYFSINPNEEGFSGFMCTSNSDPLCLGYFLFLFIFLLVINLTGIKEKIMRSSAFLGEMCFYIQAEIHFVIFVLVQGL